MLNPEHTKIEVETRAGGKLEQELKQTAWGNKIISANGQKVILQMKKNEVPDFIRRMAEMKEDIYAIHSKNSLEDYFLSLTAH
jgi:ABC-2 type transport system ATP-binding protein/bacitracin transport system ATP-binding protein